MSPSQIDKTVWRNLLFLSKIIYKEDGQELLRDAPIRFSSEKLVDQNKKQIIIPVSENLKHPPLKFWEVPFGKTSVTLFSSISQPEGWSGYPDDSNPVWWISPRGCLTPAFNLWPIIKDFMCFGEERRESHRDKHDRFPIEASWRYEAGVTHVPFINDFLAVIVDAAAHFKDSDHTLLSGVKQFVTPPKIVLSHDLDNLTGGGFWTQLSRLVRFVRGLSRGQMKAFFNLNYFFKNLISPHKFYYMDQIKMFEIEEKFGFRSISYILNGRNGRLGARTPLKLSAKLVSEAPESAEFGMHYNYNYVKKQHLFSSQKSDIESIVNVDIVSGRAHYLCFNPLTDFDMLMKNSIGLDESVGWPYKNSFRVGIAGPFLPIDPITGEQGGVIELPMTFMDYDLHRDDGTSSSFNSIFNHISNVGGCLTILVHPGASGNPEYPEMLGVYEKILQKCVDAQCKALTPGEILQIYRLTD